MILKNVIPILEYDDSSAEVIAPDHDCEGLKLPEKCLFAFLGDVVHTYAESSCAEVVLELITVSQTIKIYVPMRIYVWCSLRSARLLPRRFWTRWSHAVSKK